MVKEMVWIALPQACSLETAIRVPYASSEVQTILTTKRGGYRSHASLPTANTVALVGRQGNITISL